MCNPTTTPPLHDDRASSPNSIRRENVQVASSRRRPQHSTTNTNNQGNDRRSTYQRTNSFSKGTKVAEAQGKKWRRRIILGLILVGCAFVGLLIFLLRDPQKVLQALLRLFKLRQKRVSDFSGKPTVVGYLDLSSSSSTPKPHPRSTGRNGLTTTQLLYSKYKPVVRIHPTTFQVSEAPPLQQDTTWALRRGSNNNPAPSNHAINTTAITWNWNHHKVDLMGLEIPDMVDWEHYQFPKNDPDQEEEQNNPCKLPHEWMKRSFPTCNNLHQYDMMAQLLDQHRVQPKFLMGTGSMRQAWAVEQINKADEPVDVVVLKTLKMKHDFDKSDLDRHRRDALISERLTGSPHILDIYGYCGNSALYQYASSGNLYDAIGAKEFRGEVMDQVAHAKWEQWTSRRKLEVAYQVASALADLHDIDHDGITSVAHDDLDITQFVSTDHGKTFQLSDFNGAPFVPYDPEEKRSCGFRALMRGGKTRSPEEYDDNQSYVTHKIDLYALGNIIYTIVEGKYPFYDLGFTETKEHILHGHRPPVSEATLNSKDKNIQVLLKAMNLCLVYNPQRRATAKKIQNLLKGHIRFGL